MSYLDQSEVYKQTSITTSNQTQLVVMLYDGALRFLHQGVEAIRRNDIEGKSTACDRALAIVQHLHLSLDMERGEEISSELERLYSFVIAQIVEGSGQFDAGKLEEAIKVLCSYLVGSLQADIDHDFEPDLTGRDAHMTVPSASCISRGHPAERLEGKSTACDRRWQSSSTCISRSTWSAAKRYRSWSVCTLRHRSDRPV